MTPHKPRPQLPNKTRSELVQALQLKQAEVEALDDEIAELHPLRSSQGQQRYDELQRMKDAALEGWKGIMSALQVVHAWVEVMSLVVVDPQLLSDDAQQEIAALIEAGVAAPIEATGNREWWELRRTVNGEQFVLRPARPNPEIGRAHV